MIEENVSATSAVLDLKRKLLAECVKVQKGMVENLRNTMKEAERSAMEHDEPSEDTMMDSFREEMQNKRDMFARQYEAALEELALLNKLTIEPYDTVQFGAIVRTSENNLFISISIGKIEVDGTTYFAISPLAPLYKVLTGLKAGESGTFRDKKITVKEVA